MAGMSGGSILACQGVGDPLMPAYRSMKTGQRYTIKIKKLKSKECCGREWGMEGTGSTASISHDSESTINVGHQIRRQQQTNGNIG